MTELIARSAGRLVRGRRPSGLQRSLCARLTASDPSSLSKGASGETYGKARCADEDGAIGHGDSRPVGNRMGMG